MILGDNITPVKSIEFNSINLSAISGVNFDSSPMIDADGINPDFANLSN
jgi:hypothetical protein